jgi:hypothetical protein
MVRPEDTIRGTNTYLGDGVYASFDGYQIWLRTPRENCWHEIALEPPVLEALDAYRRKLETEKESPDAAR